MANPNSLLNRVLEIAPDIKIGSARINSEGLSNEVLIVNEAFVFRFPKNEYGKQQLAKEVEILRLLRKHLSLQTPDPLYYTVF